MRDAYYVMYPFLQKLSLVIIAGLTAFFAITVSGVLLLWLWSVSDDEGRQPEGCNVAVIPIVGGIANGDQDDPTTPTASADRIIKETETADDADDVKAVMIRIDSPGGNVVASRSVMDAIKRIDKPTVALIRENGTSGAFLAATGADWIVASMDSDTGGIGVTMSYVQNAVQNAREGKEYIEISSGKFKNAGDPNRALTEEELKLFKRDAQIVHQHFVESVATNRHLSVESVAALADGSTVLGGVALEKGLIDALGDYQTARDWLAKQIGEPAVLCDTE